MDVCAECGRQLPPSKPGGRRRIYCDKQCARRGYRKRNPEKVKASARKWYAANRKKQAAYNKAWRERTGWRPSDQSPIRADWLNRRGTLRPLVLERSGHHCVVCGADHTLEIDHILPVARGGDNDIANLQALCKCCNRRKHTRTMEEFWTYVQSDEQCVACLGGVTGRERPQAYDVDGLTGHAPAYSHDAQCTCIDCFNEDWRGRSAYWPATFPVAFEEFAQNYGRPAENHGGVILTDYFTVYGYFAD